VSILARRDSVSIAGMTKTDSLGYFSAPVDGFSGSMDALIQTRNEGKKWNARSPEDTEARKDVYLSVGKGHTSASHVPTEGHPTF